MLSYIFSAFLGVFVEKMISIGNKKDRTIVIIILPFFLIFSALFYWCLGKINEPPAIYKAIQTWFNGFENNIFAQIILIIITILGIFILDRKKEGMLSSGMYSKKIRDFTDDAREGSTVSIMAGDMNFFGRIEIKTTDNVSFNDNSNSLKLMDENEEYKQLLRKRDENIKLQILCKHGLETGQFKSVINETMSYVHLYTRERQNGNLNDNTFQQLLRIGKIKKDFGSSVEILFYNSDSEDIQLRGRLIDKKGIIYQKEKERSRFIPKKFKKFPFFKLKKQRETLYSVKYLNEQEVKNYNDLFFLKRDNCNRENSQKIVTFCERLYNYINNQENKYYMALVYVNSYEIARKKEKRKEFPPFGVLYLAACVDELPEWKVDLIAVDEHTKPSELKKWAEYDVIGASIISSYSYGILKRCFNASEKKKDVVILAGGYQAEKFSNEVFRDFNANIIFKGEGEDSIRDFCRHYPNGDYSEIRGILYRDDSNQIHPTQGRGCVDIDKIPVPARKLLNTNDVVMTNRLAGTDLRMVHMLFSRGCPYDCYYCAANQNGNNKRIRYRDKIKIVQELEDLKGIYNIHGFSIIDDCFLTCEEKAIEICEYLTESGIDLKWSLAARVDNINDNVLNALKNAGCIEIKFGVETGSDELLKKMHKGDNVTVACAEAAIRKTKEYGIGVKLFMITGLPGESDITHTETKNFLQKMYDEKLVDRVSLLRYTPLAGSHIYEHPDDFAVDKRKLNIETFEKTRLYKESFDWWIEKDRIEKCNLWYEEMQSFIEKLWGDK